MVHKLRLASHNYSIFKQWKINNSKNQLNLIEDIYNSFFFGKCLTMCLKNRGKKDFKIIMEIKWSLNLNDKKVHLFEIVFFLSKNIVWECLIFSKNRKIYRRPAPWNILPSFLIWLPLRKHFSHCSCSYIIGFGLNVRNRNNV